MGCARDTGIVSGSAGDGWASSSTAPRAAAKPSAAMSPWRPLCEPTAAPTREPLATMGMSSTLPGAAKKPVPCKHKATSTQYKHTANNSQSQAHNHKHRATNTITHNRKTTTKRKTTNTQSHNRKHNHKHPITKTQQQSQTHSHSHNTRARLQQLGLVPQKHQPLICPAA